MRRLLCLLLAIATSAAAPAAPLSQGDENALRDLAGRYVRGWLENDRQTVMGTLAPDAVFIPHDGVQPHIGYQRIDEFWFPGGKAVGSVPAYTQTITAVDGADNNATLYGRFDLTWVDGSATKRYNWIGNYLIVARREQARWLITHMMVSDAEPSITPVVGESPRPL